MLLFRSLTVGLVAACFLLQLERGSATTIIQRPAAAPTIVMPPLPAGEPVTVIDVAGGVPSSQLAALVHLDPGEHVTEVDDRRVATDLEAGSAIAAHATRYIDLTVASNAASRRVLMLLH